MNGSKLARTLIAAASMMFAAGAAAQLPPQIGSFQTMLVEHPSIFPTTISIINPNTGQDLVDVTIAVTLPAGLTGQFGYFDNPQPPALACSGNITAGPGSVTVSSGVIPAATQCTLVVYHQSAAVGFYDNMDVSITSSANPVTPVTTTPPSLAAEPIVVYAMPTATVSFAPARIAPGTSSILSFTFANPDPNFTTNFNTVQTIGLGTLVAGATVFEDPPSCASGEGPPFIDAGFLNIYYATLPPGSTCTVFVDVTGPALGAGSISEGHPVPDQTSGNFTPDLHYSGPLSPMTYNVYPMPVTVPQATLTVVGPELSVSPPTVAFPPTPVAGGAGPVTVTVSNTGTLPLALFGPLMQVGTFSISGTCPEAPVTLAPATSCTLDFSFSPIAPGVQSTSFLIQSDGGSVTIGMSGEGVLTPPAVTWSLDPPSVIAGDPSSLRMQISNANGASFDSPGFTYTLPAGVQVATTNYSYSASPCSGTMTPPTPGDTSFSVSGLSVPSSGFCEYMIEVTSTVPGMYSVQMAPGAIYGSVFLLTGVTSAASNTVTLIVNAAPAASVSPASLAFADQRVGTASASQAVTLSSTGSAVLNITSIATTGDFAHTTTCGSTLGAGTSCTIDVSFTPTATGTRAGVLTITDDAPGSPRSVSLGGNGVAPVLGVSPMTVAFPGSTSIGQTSAPIPVMVTNTGGAPLTFSGTIMATGEFNVASSCPLPPSSLAPMASCNLDVTFTPGATGPRNGTIPITSDGGSALVDLSGDGWLTLPLVTWNFSPLSVIAGNPSTLQVQITNSNGAPFDSPGFTYNLPSGLVAANSNYGYSASPCLGTLSQPAAGDTSFTVTGLSVPTFGACAYTIEVTSATPGTYNVQMAPGAMVGSVLLQSGVTNAASNTASLVVTAVPAPVLSLSPAPPGPLAFGNVTVGSVSAVQTVTLINAGDAPLAFSGPPAVTGAFTVNAATATPCPVSPATLPASPGPGNLCTVEVQFAPSVVGPASGTLAIASDGGSASFNLSGTGDPVPVPVVSLSPTSLTFASQAVGTVSGAQLVLLDNVGTAPLAISSITTGGDFAHSATCPIAPTTLPAGFGCDISVTFSPLLSGGRTGAVTITSNAAGSPHLVSLSGTGSLVAVPAISVAPTSLSFPQTQIGTPSAPASVRVTNSGTAPLSVSVVRIIGGGFSIDSDGCTGTIAAGAGCDITVVFTPAVDGTVAGTLDIASNAPDSPARVPLSGRGALAPLATLSARPGSLSFAEQTIGTASPAQTVTLTNTGTATATVSGLTVTGDYAQANNCASVPADGNCTITVTFTPAGSGPRPGSIVISANASNAPITIGLSGTGIPPPEPVIELSVSSLSYGNTMIGRGTGSQSFTLRNAGGAPLTITGMSISDEFPVSSGCPGVVPAGETCRIDVGFLPSVSGLRSGRLDVLSNASNGTVGVGLSGTGCRFSFLGRNPTLICQ